ncbi:MAG: pantoate--beta-alanine ligase [Chlorobi bacterium]|nr:pantoate--beta-alanine ligase [Chlorobiota bacterium]
MIQVVNANRVRKIIARYRKNKLTVGFVPTMGALHEGHLSLVRCSRRMSDLTVVSIFVNPTQFNDPNDLEKYPRNPERDVKKLSPLLSENDIIFSPDVSEIYPEPDTRVFDLDPLDKIMEGKFRPGHFNGVAQVVSRLFEIILPDRAFFGSKDFQQVAVIRKLMDILHMPVDIISCPVIREKDGLAMSSRNQLLSKEARKEAPLIYTTLKMAAEKAGDIPVEQLRKLVTLKINQSHYLKLEYFEIVRKDTLMPVRTWDEPAGIQACIAVWAGNVRLIDNIALTE